MERGILLEDVVDVFDVVEGIVDEERQFRRFAQLVAQCLGQFVTD